MMDVTGRSSGCTHRFRFLLVDRILAFEGEKPDLGMKSSRYDAVLSGGTFLVIGDAGSAGQKYAAGSHAQLASMLMSKRTSLSGIGLFHERR